MKRRKQATPLNDTAEQHKSEMQNAHTQRQDGGDDLRVTLLFLANEFEADVSDVLVPSYRNE